ncbi:MAG: isocitrate lyase/phosphoenolpyruvate mutase family protein [Comamonadaceae bacterium]|nr:MAG: isocitrate lyase/phosphoenolpyruvate mutase family protein [Comamonadaceae bacterium]
MPAHALANALSDPSSQVRPSVADKRRRFRELHETGCFLIPNPWDIGSARRLQALGAVALASTSAGVAWSQGLPDGAVSRDAMLEHLRTLVAATDVPVNADFENGFGDTPEAVAHSVRLAIDTGVAGLSIEDASGDANAPLFALDVAVARLRAARAAIDASGADVLLVGRTEGFFMGRPDLPDTLTRLRAYAEAGADCLYAPGLRTADEVAAVVAAVAPRPINVLIGAAGGLTLQQAADLGARRVSVGGALARVAWGGFERAARQMLTQGRFDALADAMPGAELNTFFRADAAVRAHPQP